MHTRTFHVMNGVLFGHREKETPTMRKAECAQHAAGADVMGDGVLRWWEEYVRRLDGGHYHVTHLLPADQVHDGGLNFGA